MSEYWSSGQDRRKWPNQHSTLKKKSFFTQRTVILNIIIISSQPHKQTLLARDVPESSISSAHPPSSSLTTFTSTLEPDTSLSISLSLSFKLVESLEVTWLLERSRDEVHDLNWHWQWWWSLPPEDAPSFLNFTLRFWNQIFTCFSDRFR